MGNGLDNNSTPVTRLDRRSRAPLAASLALLLCIFFLFRDMAAAGEHPPAVGNPAVVIYVGSG